MNHSEKIIVTGLGIVSTLGCDLDTVSDSLRNEKSGIVMDSSRKQLGYRSGLTGCLRDFDIQHTGFSKKQLKTMGEAALYACAAAKDALADSGIDIESVSERAGVVVGNDSCIRSSHEAVSTLLSRKDSKMIGSGAIFQSMNSTASMNLSSLYGIKGYNITISAACSSGAYAIGHSLSLLKSGILDCVICGAAQELNWEVYAPFDALGAFSGLEENPQSASRPFDRNRDGLVPSGGGAMLILERESFARKRGAGKVYGEIAGFGFSSDGAHLSVPSGEGGQRAIVHALNNAGMKASEIDYVNAHATSTPEGDRVEAQMIATILGSDVPVSSTKSLTGHECWMAGASEVIYSLLMMNNGFLASNSNFEAQEPEAAPINILREVQNTSVNSVMSNSFGFGGTNAVLILKKV